MTTPKQTEWRHGQVAPWPSGAMAEWPCATFVDTNKSEFSIVGGLEKFPQMRRKRQKKKHFCGGEANRVDKLL